MCSGDVEKGTVDACQGDSGGKVLLVDPSLINLTYVVEFDIGRQIATVWTRECVGWGAWVL